MEMDDLLKDIQKPIYILNANIGAVNKLNIKDLIPIVNKTLDAIINTLIPTYGPYGIPNLIIRDHFSSSFSVNIFTQDGKHNIEALEFISPIQRYLSNLILYIGKKVEEEAYDGTTTAMLLACYIIKWFYEIFIEPSLNDIKDSNIINFYATLHDITHTFNIVLDKISEELETYKIHPDKLTKQDLYYLVLTTTKGNEFLAKTLSDIFYDVPKELIECFVYERSNIETDKQFDIVYPKYDYDVSISNYNKNYNNKDLKERFYSENCALIILEDFFNIEDQIQKQKLDKLITTTINVYNPEYIFILYYETNSPTMLIREYEKKIKNTQIITAQYQAFHVSLVGTNTELTGLRILLGTKLFNAIDLYNINNETINKYIKYPLTIDIFNNIMGISGIYTNLEKYKKLHPWYAKIIYGSKDPELNNINVPTEYINLINDIKNNIKMLKSRHIKTDPYKIQAYIKLLKKLIAYKMPYIKLGGTTLDVLSNIDILEDANGVIISAKHDGIIINGLNKLLSITKKFKTDKNDQYPYIEVVKNILLYAIEDVLELTKDVDIDHEPYQSFGVYKAMIKRFKEVLPRFLSIANIIVPGTVVFDENK